jgi:hypothetical protein
MTEINETKKSCDNGDCKLGRAFAVENEIKPFLIVILNEKPLTYY